jgi:hypothetical protein
MPCSIRELKEALKCQEQRVNRKLVADGWSSESSDSLDNIGDEVAVLRPTKVRSPDDLTS